MKPTFGPKPNIYIFFFFAVQYILVLIYFIYSSLYLLIPYLIFSLPFSLPLVTTSFSLCHLSLFQFYYIHSFVLYHRIHM